MDDHRLPTFHIPMERVEEIIAAGRQRACTAADQEQLPPGYKRCPKCTRILLISDINFNRRTEATDGFKYICRACDKQYQKMLRAKNKFNQGKY